MKFLGCIIICFLTCTLFSQRFDDVLITTYKLNDNMSVLFGAGGNIAVFHGQDGVLLIDDQFAELSEKINATIDSLSGDKVKFLVNTHWHGDHTGGNLAFAEEGALIVAHDAVRKRLGVDQIRPFGRSVEASPEKAWPVLTFNEEMQIHFNGESVQLIHVHNAHTDGDAFVYFPSYNVLHMGDCFFRDKFPYIDLGSGGTPEGCIAAVEAALMICDADTQIIPGHGAIANKEDLQRYHQMLQIVTDRVQRAINNGAARNALPLEDITKGFDGWGDGFITGEKFSQTLYKALKSNTDTEKAEQGKVDKPKRRQE